MSNPPLDHLIPDFGEYAPEGIWAEPALPAESEPAPAEAAPEVVQDPNPVSVPEAEAAPEPSSPSIPETPSQRARREVMETFGRALLRYSREGDIPSPTQPQDESAPAAISVSFPGYAPESETKTTEESPSIPLFPEKQDAPTENIPPEVTSPDGTEPKDNDTSAPAEPEFEDFSPELPYESKAYTAEDVSFSEENTAEEERTSPFARFRRKTAEDPEESSGPSLKERFLTPILFFFAALISRREMQQAEAARWPDPEDEPLPPELSPKKAAKFYGTQAKPLRLRCRLSLILTLILTWLSLQLPMFGLLGKDLRAQAGVCLVLTLTVMLLSLDVITVGFRQLFDLHPGAESLAALAALLCSMDAAIVYAGHGASLPYCAAACLSLTAALWGQRLTCSARRRTFLAASGKEVTVMNVQEGNHETPAKILRAPLDTESIVRRTEEEDVAQSTYAAAAPIFILVALVLAILSSLNGRANSFLHIFSALITVTSALSAFILFPLPYALAARRLLDSGAALLGWAGIADLGRRPSLVVLDEDIFPPDDDILKGHIRFSSIYLPEDADTSTVLSYTCSILAASEGGLAHPFISLAKQRWLSLMPLEEFSVREGGGYSATIDGTPVMVGSLSFMKLMGVRIPPKMEADTAIYTAVHGELAASFLMEYTPTTNVQNALITLLRGRSRAIFGLRNFCITPRVLSRMYRLPAERLNIPSFETRCKLADEISYTNVASAIYRIGGLMSAVDLTETSRRLRNACRISMAISLAGSVLGMLILFLLFRANAFGPASAGNLVLYMILWTLPVVILSVGQSR